MFLESPVFSEIELIHEIPNKNYAHMALSSNDNENIINFSGEDYLAAKSINVIEGRQISLGIYLILKSLKKSSFLSQIFQTKLKFVILSKKFFS